MNKDLTTSKIARQNVLNNRYALQEIQKAVGLPGIIFRGQLIFTKTQVASFFGVSLRSIETCIMGHKTKRNKGIETGVGAKLLRK